MTPLFSSVAHLLKRQRLGTAKRTGYVCCYCTQSVSVTRLARRGQRLFVPRDRYRELPWRRFLKHGAHGKPCPGSGQPLVYARGWDR